MIDKFIDGLEEIFADIRERHVDDSVCGLCEYDGAYLGQSGDWCKECPGFDKDDCFKLSDKTRKKWTDEIIKALPSAQPEIRTQMSSANCISREAAIDAIERMKPYQLDGDDCIEIIANLPTAEPSIILCKECKYVSYEPCEGYENVYVCNRTPWSRFRGGNMPDDFCSKGEMEENG